MSPLMTRAAIAKLVPSLVIGVVTCASSFLFSASTAAQSPTARLAQTSRTTPAPRVNQAVKSGARARAINAEEMQGLLKRDSNHPLLVNYWATWCDPCRDEFPDLVKIDKQYRAKGLDFIAITLDDLADINTAVPKFLREMKATMPVYLLNVADPEPAIKSVDREWSGALPATFLYNNKGEVVYKHFGRIKVDELRAAVEKLVGGKEQKAEGTKQ
jgi:thiol-disulfide isomerase/thioredoxin